MVSVIGHPMRGVTVVAAESVVRPDGTCEVVLECRIARWRIWLQALRSVLRGQVRIVRSR